MTPDQLAGLLTAVLVLTLALYGMVRR